ncbi:MAG: Lrp/AsnC family transcriptional regulator [Syntrophobacteraceae bacterium]
MQAAARMLLDRLQRSFPLTSEPYASLALTVGMKDAKEVQSRIRDFKEQKLVRQISAIFNTGAMGHMSSLVAMAAPEGHVDEAARVVNSHPGVSHNYLRPGRFNLWFTIAVPPGASLDREVDKLAASAGGWPTLILPAKRKYKLAVVLDVLEEGDEEAGEERMGVPPVEALIPFQATPENVRIVRCIQEDLPLVDKPFNVWAEALGMSERELITTMSEWLKAGYIRRFAAILDHRRAGFSANGMVVWNCPEERIDASGASLAAHPEVSHCYHRPAHPPQWPYNLYAMVHGRSSEECMKIAERLGESIGIPQCDVLFSTREYKKIRLKLFWETSENCKNGERIHYGG